VQLATVIADVDPYLPPGQRVQKPAPRVLYSLAPPATHTHIHCARYPPTVCADPASGGFQRPCAAQVILRSVTAFERHDTNTAYHRAVAVKLFLALFLNTALTVVVVNARLKNVDVPSAVGVFSGQFTGFSPLWFSGGSGSFSSLSQLGYLNLPISTCLSQLAYLNLPISTCLSQLAYLKGKHGRCLPLPEQLCCLWCCFGGRGAC
jgi:hypothetical protein